GWKRSGDSRKRILDGHRGFSILGIHPRQWGLWWTKLSFIPGAYRLGEMAKDLRACAAPRVRPVHLSARCNAPISSSLLYKCGETRRFPRRAATRILSAARAAASFEASCSNRAVTIGDSQ